MILWAQRDLQAGPYRERICLARESGGRIHDLRFLQLGAKTKLVFKVDYHKTPSELLALIRLGVKSSCDINSDKKNYRVVDRSDDSYSLEISPRVPTGSTLSVSVRVAPQISKEAAKPIEALANGARFEDFSMLLDEQQTIFEFMVHENSDKFENQSLTPKWIYIRKHAMWWYQDAGWDMKESIEGKSGRIINDELPGWLSLCLSFTETRTLFRKRPAHLPKGYAR